MVYFTLQLEATRHHHDEADTAEMTTMSRWNPHEEFSTFEHSVDTTPRLVRREASRREVFGKRHSTDQTPGIPSRILSPIAKIISPTTTTTTTVSLTPTTSSASTKMEQKNELFNKQANFLQMPQAFSLLSPTLQSPVPKLTRTKLSEASFQEDKKSPIIPVKESGKSKSSSSNKSKSSKKKANNSNIPNITTTTEDYLLSSPTPNPFAGAADEEHALCSSNADQKNKRNIDSKPGLPQRFVSPSQIAQRMPVRLESTLSEARGSKTTSDMNCYDGVEPETPTKPVTPPKFIPPVVTTRVESHNIDVTCSNAKDDDKYGYEHHTPCQRSTQELQRQRSSMKGHNPLNRRRSMGDVITVKLPTNYHLNNNSTLRRQRAISFDHDLDIVHPITPILLKVDNKKEELWYPRNHLTESKIRIRSILRHIESSFLEDEEEPILEDDGGHQRRGNSSNNNDPSSIGANNNHHNTSTISDDSFCLRGIECFMTTEMKQSNKRLDDLYNHILDLQDIQRNKPGGFHDSCQLAYYSEQITKESKQLAIDRAIKDALEVSQNLYGPELDDEEGGEHTSSIGKKASQQQQRPPRPQGRSRRMSMGW